MVVIYMRLLVMSIKHMIIQKEFMLLVNALSYSHNRFKQQVLFNRINNQLQNSKDLALIFILSGVPMIFEAHIHIASL